MDTNSANAISPIRVFISSTFLDMQAERDVIVNVVFPNLRRRFRSSGREIIDVDLRWGVTEEQAKRGETAGLCLAEIDRCRPFFIGMVGYRYGSALDPKSFPPLLLRAYPVLNGRPGRSLTEIEFEYGPLGEPQAVQHAFFLIRTPDTSEKSADFSAAALRQRVRSSGFPVIEYAKPQEIAEPMETMLAAAIAHRIGDADSPGAIEYIDRLHEAYARERRRNYQGTRERVTRLDMLVDRPSAPLVLIEGEAGSGKSALIANWITLHQARHPHDIIVSHFLGSSSESAAPVEIMQRTIRLIEAAAGFEAAPQPRTGPALVTAFAEMVRRGGAVAQNRGGRLIVALDGLDKLTEWTDLRWLPHSPAANVLVLTSALPGRVRDELIERGCARHIVAPMCEGERRSFVQERLGQFAKALDQNQLEQIVARPLTASPIALQTIVNELRVFGHYAELNSRILRYLSAQSLPDLFDRVLLGVENACGVPLTAAVTQSIYVSRVGIEEASLTNITGATRLDLAAILLRLGDGIWEHEGRLSFAHDHLMEAVKRRYLSDASAEHAAREKLVRHFDPRTVVNDAWQDYLTISGESWLHTERRRTPEESFARLMKAMTRLQETGPLSPLEREGKAHTTLQPLIIDVDPVIPTDLARRIEEIPYQLAQMQDRERLRALLTDARWFNALYERGQMEMQRYWAAVGCHRAQAEADLCGMIDAQLPEYAKWTKRQWKMVLKVIIFLKEAGWATARSMEVMRHHTELEIEIYGNTHPAGLDAAHRLAVFESSLGLNSQALSRIEEVIDEREDILGEDHPSILLSQALRAKAMRDAGKTQEAKDILERIQPKVAAAFGTDAEETVDVTTALANSLHDLGEVERAQGVRMELLENCVRVFGQDNPKTLELMSGIAVGMRLLGKTTDSCAMHARVLERRRVVQGTDHPATIATLLAYGNALAQARRFKEAKKQFSEALALASARIDSGAMVRHAKRALIDATLMGGGEDIEATARMEGSLVEDFEASDEKESELAVDSMMSYGAALTAMGRLDEAHSILQKALAVESRRQPLNAKRVCYCKVTLARLLVEKVELPAAKRLLQEVVDTQLGSGTLTDDDALYNIRQLLDVLVHQGENEAALKLYASIPETALAGVDESTTGCRATAALALHQCGRYKEAIEQYEKIFAKFIDSEQNVSTEIFLRYAQSCYAHGEVERAEHAEAILLHQWQAVPDEPQQEKLLSLMNIGRLARLQFGRGDLDAAEKATRYILENEIRIFGANSSQAAQTRSNLAVIAEERVAKLSSHPTNARADRVAAIVEQVLSGAITEFRSGLNLDQLPGVAGTEGLAAIRQVLSELRPPISLEQLTLRQLLLILDAMTTVDFS